MGAFVAPPDVGMIGTSPPNQRLRAAPARSTTWQSSGNETNLLISKLKGNLRMPFEPLLRTARNACGFEPDGSNAGCHGGMVAPSRANSASRSQVILSVGRLPF
jgi:hypothetical protein